MLRNDPEQRYKYYVTTDPKTWELSSNSASPENGRSLLPHYQQAQQHLHNPGTVAEPGTGQPERYITRTTTTTPKIIPETAMWIGTTSTNTNTGPPHHNWTARRTAMETGNNIQPPLQHSTWTAPAAPTSSPTVLDTCVVSKAKARHQPAPHPGILLVNHKGNSSTLMNCLLGTTSGGHIQGLIVL